MYIFSPKISFFKFEYNDNLNNTAGIKIAIAFRIEKPRTYVSLVLANAPISSDTSPANTIKLSEKIFVIPEKYRTKIIKKNKSNNLILLRKIRSIKIYGIKSNEEKCNVDANKIIIILFKGEIFSFLKKKVKYK